MAQRNAMGTAQRNTIVINGRFLSQNITGVQRFALESVKQLDTIIDASLNWTLALPPNILHENIPRLKNISIIQFGRFTGIAWEQISLAWFLYKNHALGIHLCNTVPLFFPRGIVAIHDITYKIHPEFITTKKLRIMRLWHLLQNRIAIKKSYAILTVSEFSKKQIAETYNISTEKITVVYNGWQHFKTHIANANTINNYQFLKSHNYFFSMATVAKNKNFAWIIEAAKYNPHETFAVAGSSDLKKLGVSLATQDSTPNLYYLGYVSDDDAKSLMKNCKAFLFPSLYEGFGIPPLEALALGAPVVCSSAACLPEIFKNSVHYIDPYDAHIDLNKLLSQKVASPDTVLDCYSWEKTAKKIYVAITSVL